MAILVGREEEIGCLESIYSRNGLRTCAVYGNRRVGTSSVLREFCRGKRAIVFTFRDRSVYENLWSMHSDICRFSGMDMPLFENLEVAMDALAVMSRKPGLVVVFDHFENLVAKAPEAPRIVSDFLSRISDTETMFIIAGSTSDAFPDLLVGPIATRFEDRVVVPPLTLEQSMEFHRDMSLADAVKVYMTVGGIPAYHRAMDGSSFRKAVERCFLGPDPSLGAEIERLIADMPTPVDAHSAIASCIADGLNRQSEIVARLDMTKSLCKRYMDDMTDSGLAEILNPMLNSPKRPVYRLTDGLLAFYYHVLRRHEGALADEDVKSTYRDMENDIWDFLTDRFTTMCAEFIADELDATDVGRWWSRDDADDSEIPVVATADDGTGRVWTVLGDCRFREKRVGMKTLAKLMARAESMGLENCRFVVFSASGFSSELESYASSNNVWLVELEDMVGVMADRM